MTDTPKPIDWDELAQAIADGEAVLVLGPDAIPLYRLGPAPENDPDEPAEMTFSSLTRRRIHRSPKAAVSYFYTRDNLFLFRDKDGKAEAQKIVKRCANDPAWLPDAALLDQIAAMKFPVVLSLSPDDYLLRTFAQYGLPRQFDYFTAKDKTAPEAALSQPKAGLPLLYQLCGYAPEDDYDSVILDYYDLFGLLTALLGDLNVPDVLRGKLKKSSRFVLLGFHLEHWYAQLLLHYINKLDGEFDNRNHNFAMLAEVGPDDRAFIVEQFNMKCIAPNRADFDALYEACRRQKALRDLPDPLAGPALEIRLLVEKDDLPAALESLGKYLGDPDTVSMLKSQFHEYLKHVEAKDLDSSALGLLKNQLRSRILTFSASLT